MAKKIYVGCYTEMNETREERGLETELIEKST